MSGNTIRGLLLGAGIVVLSSCALEREGDFRNVVSPTPSREGRETAAAGVTRITSSRDSEFLFFCPSPDGRWGVFASNRHSVNLRLYRSELNRSGLLYAIPGADVGNVTETVISGLTPGET